MNRHALPYAVLGAFAAVLVLAAFAALRSSWRAWRISARTRRGLEGEQRARVLLERAGWRVLEHHPPASLLLRVDGEDVVQPLTADYLCERGGRVLPAEVKTGDAADPCARATRRQLLEYAVAYRSGAALFVDADAGDVVEVAFHEAPRRSWAGVAIALGVGAVIGAAAARLVPWG